MKRNTDDADDAKEEKINDMAGMAKGNVIQAETTDRPEISTVVIDEDTGIEKIAQGKAGECSSHCKDEAGNCPFSKNATKKPKCNYRSGILERYLLLHSLPRKKTLCQGSSKLYWLAFVIKRQSQQFNILRRCRDA